MIPNGNLFTDEMKSTIINSQQGISNYGIFMINKKKRSLTLCNITDLALTKITFYIDNYTNIRLYGSPNNIQNNKD